MSHVFKQGYVENSAEVTDTNVSFKFSVPGSFVVVAEDQWGIKHRDATNAEIAARIANVLSLPKEIVSVAESGVTKAGKNNHYDISVVTSRPVGAPESKATQAFDALKKSVAAIVEDEAEKAHGEALEEHKERGFAR